MASAPIAALRNRWNPYVCIEVSLPRGGARGAFGSAIFLRRAAAYREEDHSAGVIVVTAGYCARPQVVSSPWRLLRGPARGVGDPHAFAPCALVRAQTIRHLTDPKSASAYAESEV